MCSVGERVWEPLVYGNESLNMTGLKPPMHTAGSLCRMILYCWDMSSADIDNSSHALTLIKASGEKCRNERNLQQLKL